MRVGGGNGEVKRNGKCDKMAKCWRGEAYILMRGKAIISTIGLYTCTILTINVQNHQA